MTPIPGNLPPLPLQVHYDSLVVAIGTGAKVLRFQDRTIEYNSTEEMICAANFLWLKLYGSTMNRQIRTYTNKGL